MSLLRLPPLQRPAIGCHLFTLRFTFCKTFGQPLRTNLHSKQFHVSYRGQLAARTSLPPPEHSTSARKTSNALAYVGGRKPNQTLAESLASKPSLTLLYQAPSHIVYMTTCCILGAFCITWSVFNFYGTFINPVGQPGSFVFIAMGTTIILVAAGGVAAMRRVSHIIPTDPVS